MSEYRTGDPVCTCRDSLTAGRAWCPIHDNYAGHPREQKPLQIPQPSDEQRDTPGGHSLVVEQAKPVAWQQKDRYGDWTQINIEFQPIEWWEKYGPVRPLYTAPQGDERLKEALEKIISVEFSGASFGDVRTIAREALGVSELDVPNPSGLYRKRLETLATPELVQEETE